MITIGITGGVGAGKSSVLAMIGEYCDSRAIPAVLLETDKVARALQRKGERVFQEIVHAFGRGVVGEDGELNRQMLADLVFHDEEKLKRLNLIVHPAVKQDVCKAQQEAKQSGAKLFVIESALLLENEYDQICDAVWLVTAEQPERIRRLAASRGYTEAKSRSIMSNQSLESEWLERCSAVIDNSGTPERTRAQVRRFLDAYFVSEPDRSEGNEKIK